MRIIYLTDCNGCFKDIMGCHVNMYFRVNTTVQTLCSHNAHQKYNIMKCLLKIRPYMIRCWKWETQLSKIGKDHMTQMRHRSTSMEGKGIEKEKKKERNQGTMQ